MAHMIAPSKLDRRISIERETKTVDDYGRETSAWTIVASRRAELVTASLDELLKPFGEEETRAIVFRLRFVADVTTADRITYAGRAYNIRDVQEIGRRRGLEIRCEAAS